MWEKRTNKESKHVVAMNKPLTGKKINLFLFLFVLFVWMHPANAQVPSGYLSTD